MCVPRPIDLVVIDKKSSISFRLKFGKQSEEGSISNYPLPEGNYFSQEPIVSLPMLEQCSSGIELDENVPKSPSLAVLDSSTSDIVCRQGGITCGAIDEPRKSSKAIDKRVIIDFRDKNVVIARFRDKNEVFI